jgi:hypothetical protein
MVHAISLWRLYLLIIAIIVIDGTKDATMSERDNHLCFMSNTEGLMAQLSHLQDIWLLANRDNLSVNALGFYSGHYNLSQPVHLCDIFRLPASVRCINDRPDTILSNKICVSAYSEKANSDSMRNPNLAFADSTPIRCIVGKYRLHPRDRHKYLLNTKESFLQEPWFTKKYLDWANVVKRELNLTDSKYSAAHWRRGDLLITRCIKNDSSISTNVNCQDEKAFAREVQVTSKKFAATNGSRITKTYIATNENDTKILNYLRDQDFIVWTDIVEVFAKLDVSVELDSVDIFVIELILMCEADDLMLWGMSSLKDTLICPYCRNHQHYPKKRTILYGEDVSDECIANLKH